MRVRLRAKKGVKRRMRRRVKSRVDREDRGNTDKLHRELQGVCDDSHIPAYSLYVVFEIISNLVAVTMSNDFSFDEISATKSKICHH